MKAITLVWFRQDLRLADHPALYHACRNGNVIPVFIDDPLSTSISQLGSASRVWLHHSLRALDHELRSTGSRLILRRGPALDVLQQLLTETGATRIYWNRVYDPASLQRDKHIKESLHSCCEIRSFNACLLNEPWEVLKNDHTPYKVFTPYWNAMLKHGIQHQPLPAPLQLTPPEKMPESLPLESLGFLPAIRWDVDMMNHWRAGETAAMQKLLNFLTENGANYQDSRNVPSRQGTSTLSPTCISVKSVRVRPSGLQNSSWQTIRLRNTVYAISSAK